MLHATANDESITFSSVKRVALTRDPDMAVHDVHNLIVRMAVHRSNPAFHHLVSFPLAFSYQRRLLKSPREISLRPFA